MSTSNLFPREMKPLTKFNQENVTSHDIGYRVAEDLNISSAIAFLLPGCWWYVTWENGHFLWFPWCCLDALFWYLRPLQCCSRKICLSLYECIKFLPSLKWSRPSREPAAPEFIPALGVQLTGCISSRHRFGLDPLTVIILMNPVTESTIKRTSRSSCADHKSTHAR